MALCFFVETQPCDTCIIFVMAPLIFPTTLQPHRITDRTPPEFPMSEFSPDAGPDSRVLLSTIPRKATLGFEYQGLTAIQVKIIDDFYLTETYGGFDKFELPLVIFRSMRMTNTDKAMIARVSPNGLWRFKEKPKLETIITDVYKVTISLESVLL
jgi:hypothetical protein